MTSLTYEDAEKIALQAIHDTDGRGMIGRGRNHLHQRVARALLSAARDEGRAEAPVVDEGALRDAERFRALMRCPQIKMQGSAGVNPHTGERNGNNIHFGAEFWPDPLDAKFREENPASAAGTDKSTAWGRACLMHLADAILEREAALSTIRAAKT